jgi:hypothetical protein
LQQSRSAVEPLSGKLAANSLAANKWELLKPQGEKIPKPPYRVGMGYFDPRLNVLVIFPAFTEKVCFYRYKAS